MSLVRPPSFHDLVRHYGSPSRAVKELIKSGLSTDFIERKYNLPYHRVRIWSQGYEISKDYAFDDIAKLYERLITLRSIKGKETEIIKFVKLSPIEYEKKIRFLLGRINSDKRGIAENGIIRTISIVCGIPEEEGRRFFHDYGDIGDIADILFKDREPVLTVDEVYYALKIVPHLGLDERIKTIVSLLKYASPIEAKYIVRLALQDLKIRVSDKVVISAIGKAYRISLDLLFEACMILGVEEALLKARYGRDELAKYRLKPSMFIKPQLAHLYDPEKVRYPCRVEHKYDGSRLQIHRFGDRIWLYSRRGIEKSKVLPEVIDIARQIRSNCFIIDSEVVAIDKNGNLLPFVKLLNRTVRKELDKSILEEVNVTVKCFDILYYEGYNLMRQPLRTRLDILSRIVPSEYMADGINCECESELMAYYRRTLRKGLEGIMVKDLNSSYEVGVRSWSWLKLKPERDTLDVVIVKARYGRSGRAGIYSSFQIAVRDRIERKLYTIGRVANLSEQLFLQLRDRIEKLKIARDRDGIWIKPSIVLEVTYFEIQKSPDETSGFALRFPKIVSIRDDKRVEEIDTIDKVKQLFKMQYERFPEKELA